jgi:hypothetical protein
MVSAGRCLRELRDKGAARRALRYGCQHVAELEFDRGLRVPLQDGRVYRGVPFSALLQI